MDRIGVGGADKVPGLVDQSGPDLGQVRDNNPRFLRPEYPLDSGIAWYVQCLWRAGIETFESCEGGAGHAYTEPTVRFHGHIDEGWRALAVALQRGFPVAYLRRTYPVIDKEPTGPYWEIVFSARAPVVSPEEMAALEAFERGERLEAKP